MLNRDYDRFVQFLRDQGYYGSVNEAAYKFLLAQGIAAGQLNEMWNKYLTAEGYTGSLSEKSKQFSFITDDIAPTLQSTFPTDDSVDVLVDIHPTLTFSENIAFGTGNIILRDVTNSVDFEVFDVEVDIGGGTGTVSISGDTLTIEPTSDLDGSTEYAIQVDGTAIDDLAGNSFAGIADETTVSWTTKTVWPVDLTTASYDNESVDSTVSSPRGNSFGDSGNSIYLTVFTTDEIIQLKLSTAYDLSSFVSVVTEDVSAQISAPSGLHVKGDGTKLYVCDNSADAVFQYDLSTPWDLTTITYDSAFIDVSGETSSPQGMHMREDGEVLYVLSSTGDMYQYTLSTPWDISTATYASKHADIGSQTSSAQDIFIEPSGSKVYIITADVNRVFQYTLSTPWDISTLSYDNIEFDPTSEGTVPVGIEFKEDGTKMYILDGSTDSVHQYSAF